MELFNAFKVKSVFLSSKFFAKNPQQHLGYPNINPNYPDDAPDKMITKIKELGIEFPYLIDESQKVADAFKAQCTPDIYLFNKDHQLVYHGRIDDNWQDESKVTKEELKEALNNMTTGQPIAQPQRPSMGCSIKWR